MKSHYGLVNHRVGEDGGGPGQRGRGGGYIFARFFSRQLLKLLKKDTSEDRAATSQLAMMPLRM